MSSRSGFGALMGKPLLSWSPRDKPPGTREQATYGRLVASLRNRSAVNSSAGKNVSSASSDSVTSTGVPKIIVADMKLRTSPPNRSLKGIATLSGGNGADRAGIG